MVEPWWVDVLRDPTERVDPLEAARHVLKMVGFTPKDRERAGARILGALPETPSLVLDLLAYRPPGVADRDLESAALVVARRGTPSEVERLYRSNVGSPPPFSEALQATIRRRCVEERDVACASMAIRLVASPEERRELAAAIVEDPSERLSRGDQSLSPGLSSRLAVVSGDDLLTPSHARALVVAATSTPSDDHAEQVLPWGSQHGVAWSDLAPLSERVHEHLVPDLWPLPMESQRKKLKLLRESLPEGDPLRARLGPDAVQLRPPAALLEAWLRDLELNWSAVVGLELAAVTRRKEFRGRGLDGWMYMPCGRRSRAGVTGNASSLLLARSSPGSEPL